MLWKKITTDREPERPVAERPGPETTQLFTCEADQVIIEEEPDRTRIGFAEMEITEEHWLSDGAETLQVPLHRYVPELKSPHEFVG